MGASAGVQGGQSSLRGQFGGQSDTHIGAQGRLNTNGPGASDRSFGTDRADARADTDVRTSRTANSGSTSSRTKSANELGGLNASHASENAETHASANSRVGEVATYESQMRSALAISDPTRRNAAITSARQQLAQTSNKPLTSSAITQLDSSLNIQGASPTLGASR
jgi:hypothetical protein